ncbi:hypothetical protein BGZ89_000763 [Linnemannia elongata]|nr:hypothetical protein BGZ89_000763 [Linnemannia elongata]
MSQSQLGNLGTNSALVKTMETMMIKPLFPDGFVNDSDSEAETVLDIEAELSDSDDESDSSDDDSSDSDDDDEDDDDDADREVNSDLQEPSREARRRRRRQLRQQQEQQQQKRSVVGGNKGMMASSSHLLQSPAVQPKRGVQPQKEQLVSLGQLLTNVVILEEVVKEVVAVAQVRKGMGIDRVRFL